MYRYNVLCHDETGERHEALVVGPSQAVQVASMMSKCFRGMAHVYDMKRKRKRGEPCLSIGPRGSLLGDVWTNPIVKEIFG